MGLPVKSDKSSDVWQATLAERVVPVQPRRLFPQTRAVEIRLPRGFEVSDAPRLVWQVKHAGFNTILLNCFSEGYTAFPSRTMRAYGFPVQDLRFHSNDPVTPVLSAARCEGLTVYALVEGLRVGGERGRGPVLRRRPEWGVRGRDHLRGLSTPPVLCPANLDVRRFLGDLFHETLEGYSFQGLYLRHLHYPLEPADQRADFCHCDFCRRAIWLSLGVRIGDIPADPDHPDRYNLTSWRGKQLMELLRYLRLRATKASARPLTLTEVYLGEEPEPAQPESLGYVDGCSWARERGIPIAVFRPLPGTPDGSEKWIERIAAMAQCALIMPALTAPPESRQSRLLETIERLAFEPIGGVVVCEPHDLTAPPLTLLADGPWREPTQLAEDRPIASVCTLLAETVKRLPSDDPVHAFLADVLKVVEPLGERWSAAQRESLYENLLGLEERIGDEKIALGDAAPAVLRNFRLARHLLRLAEIEL
jgi:hypothetical protein